MIIELKNVSYRYQGKYQTVYGSSHGGRDPGEWKIRPGMEPERPSPGGAVRDLSELRGAANDGRQMDLSLKIRKRLRISEPFCYSLRIGY